MLRKLCAVALFALGTGTASAGEVYDKCISDTAGQDIPDVEQKCSCWADSLPGDEVAAYMAIDVANWESEATDVMNDTGASCGFGDAAP